MLQLAFLLSVHLIPQTAIDYRQPQMAASASLVAVTFGSTDTIYFSGSLDRAKTFSAPVKVAGAGALALGMHRGPRIAVTRDAVVISAIAGGELLTWRSLDGGKTWKAGPRISDQAQAAREGLHTMAATPDGKVFAAWLDLRNLVPGKPGTELWGSYSTDSGATWSKNFAVYKSPGGTICQCCHPSALFDSAGNLEVMWRNALDGNRDLYMARSTDGGRTFGTAEKLGAGSWHLDACPMDGGGLAQGANGKIITAWRREKGVYMAPEGGAETLLQEGKNPAIAAGSEGVFVAWSSPEGVFARVPGQADPVTLDHEGGFVTLAAVPNGPVIAAWERKGTIQFHTLP